MVGRAKGEGMTELVVEAGSALAAAGLTARFPRASQVGDRTDAHALRVKIPLDGAAVPAALAVVRDWLVAYGIDSTELVLDEKRYTMVSGGLGRFEQGSDDELPLDVVMDV